MPDFHVRRGETATLDRVEGELHIGYNGKIEAVNGKNVVVTKGVYLEGKAYVNCDFECESLESKTFLSREISFTVLSNRQRIEVTGRHVGHLEVNGNLTVHKQLNVSHSVQVTGSIKAEEIDVGGKIQAETIRCNRIRVGGRADIKSNFEALGTEVGGKIVAGVVKLGDLNVGGEAEVNGGIITGHIRVGGKFVSKAPLEFGELLVYGKGFLPANCKGQKISTHGKLTADGNITCSQLEVGGYVEVKGDCYADRVEVGGRFEVSGSLFISDRLEGYGNIEVRGNFESSTLRFSGKLETNKATVKDEANISGKITTNQGLKAKTLIVRSGTKCEGPLIGERVEIGKSADMSYGAWAPTLQSKWSIGWGGAVVQDIYANEVTIGPSSKAGRLFSDTVKLEQASVVEQVTYITDLKTDFSVTVREPPKKVTNLPTPPF